MPASYTPEKRKIGDILAVTSPSIVVPDWQRNYSWTTSHVETFWQDIVEFKGRERDQKDEYFLGSIVIVATEDGRHLLLDGQQRVATSVILVSVIRDYLKRYNENAATRVSQKYLADIDPATDRIEYKLTLNHYDREFFRRLVLEDRHGGYIPPAPALASHRLMRQARSYFEARFDENYEGLTPKAAYDWTLQVQAVLLNHMTVIAITSQDEDSAADVFETLNDRGIGLSTPDLLRNLILRRAPEADREDIVQLWSNVLQFETDTLIRAFLRHFWISRHGDVKTQGLYRVIKSYVRSNDVKSLDFSRQLSDAAEVYRSIIEADHRNKVIADLLKDLTGFGAGASILFPLTLCVLEEAFDDSEQIAVLRAAINLYVRYSVVCQLENSKLENVVYRVASSLRSTLDAERAVNALRAASPNDDEVVQNFAKLSVTHAATRRYLLLQFELLLRGTDELTVATAERVHVEHIYPQTPSANLRLADHEQVVDRLGNMTLLASRLNKGARNSDFGAKKPFYEKSELELTRQLLSRESWDLDAIEQRQAWMAAQAPRIWPA